MPSSNAILDWAAVTVNAIGHLPPISVKPPSRAQFSDSTVNVWQVIAPNAADSVARSMIAHDVERSIAAFVNGKSAITALAVPNAGAAALPMTSVAFVSSVFPDEATARQRARPIRCHGTLVTL